MLVKTGKAFLKQTSVKQMRIKAHKACLRQLPDIALNILPNPSKRHLQLPPKPTSRHKTNNAYLISSIYINKSTKAYKCLSKAQNLISPKVCTPNTVSLGKPSKITQTPQHREYHPKFPNHTKTLQKKHTKHKQHI